MASLTLRLAKGTALTNAELDANFSNLNADAASRLLASSNLSDLANAATARTNLGLGNVENKSSATIRSELTDLNVTTALGFTPYNATNPSGYITSAALSPYLTSAALSPYLTSASAASTYLPLTGGSGLFRKAIPDAPAWTKTGANTATTASTLYVEVNGTVRTIANGTSITMPTLTAGTDYAIWAKTDGTLEATSSHISPPTANARKVGGFHYAPGGHSGAPGGGNTTPGIWAGSFWDLKWRPNCPDPRGMEYWCGSWMDMYLTGVDAATLGSSRYNVTMADGSSPPKVPTIFGGNGSTTYGSYTWFEASELAMAMGKRLPTQREFMAHAYGTTEASSIGTDQNSTILNAAYTSAAGLFQATGVLWVWGDDRGGPAAAASWNANTEGRGSELNAPNAVFLGGSWFFGAYSGSRCSNWGYAASYSSNNIGSRFCCDHLQLD